MGARALSHSGFFCGRRGARSIWTSSTELAIRELDVNLYCTMHLPVMRFTGTQVMVRNDSFPATMRENGIWGYELGSDLAQRAAASYRISLPPSSVGSDTLGRNRAHGHFHAFASTPHDDCWYCPHFVCYRCG